jgi:threonine/homoserine/homoserine lactone efflux protein
MYLIYLGIQALRHRNELGAALTAKTEPKSIRRIATDGFLVGLSNPKAIVFFIAVLPQFVDQSAGHAPEQMLLLGAIFAAIAVVCDSAWALIAGTARTWMARSPRRMAAVGGAGGLVLIGIGASLAVSGRGE